jgi:putative membrane protein
MAPHCDPRRRTWSETMKYVTGALAVLFLILILVFAVQNRSSVDVAFLLWSMSLPKVFLILGTYVLGMFSGWGLLEVAKRVF